MGHRMSFHVFLRHLVLLSFWEFSSYLLRIKEFTKDEDQLQSSVFQWNVTFPSSRSRPLFFSFPPLIEVFSYGHEEVNGLTGWGEFEHRLRFRWSDRYLVVRMTPGLNTGGNWVSGVDTRRVSGPGPDCAKFIVGVNKFTLFRP